METLSTKNKYFFWWDNIITRASKRATDRKTAKKLLGYVEAHHIVPKSFKMGGEKDKDNIVYLNAKEHIMVHRLMCKFISCERLLPRVRKAFHCMTEVDNGGNNKRSVSLHLLAKGRESASMAMKGKPRGIQRAPSWFYISSDLDVFKSTLQKHTEDGLTDPKIAKIYKVSTTAINNWRKKLVIMGSNWQKWQLSDRDWLFHHYITMKLSTPEMAKIIGCTGTAVQYKLAEYNIPVRDAFERQQNVDKSKRGYFPAKNKNGDRYTIRKDDPRYISGELVGLSRVI